jgi:hypothetical protein
MAAGIKRKSVSESTKAVNGSKLKKVKVADHKSSKKDGAVKKSKSKPAPVLSDASMESNTSESENGFSGFGASEDEKDNDSYLEEEEDAGRRAETAKKAKTEKRVAIAGGKSQLDEFKCR